MAEKIKIGGELEPKTVEGILGDASTIVDRTNYDTPKRQDEVNAEKINFSDIKDAASASAVDWEDEDKPVSARTAKVIKEYVENKLPDDVLLDDAPTTNSDNAVKSGGTKAAIDNVAFSTSEKVNEVGIDGEPVAGSENLVKSGGVADMFKSEIIDQNLKQYYLTADGKFGTTGTYYHACVSVNAGDIYYLTDEQGGCRYAFATSDEYQSGGNIPLVSGSSVMVTGARNTYTKVVIPIGCSFLLFNAGGNFNTKCYTVKNVIKTILDMTDDVPTAESDNPVKSGGVYEKVSQLDQKIPNILLVGKGNTSVSSEYFRFANPGAYYKFTILNPNISTSEVTSAGVYVFRIQYTTNGTSWNDLLRVNVGTQLSSHYSFQIPSDTIYIKIDMRANNGEVQRIVLEDITFRYYMRTYSNDTELKSFRVNSYAFKNVPSDNPEFVLVHVNGTTITHFKFSTSEPNLTKRTSTDSGTTWSDWIITDVDSIPVLNSVYPISSGYIYQLVKNIDVINRAASGRIINYNAGPATLNNDPNADTTCVYVAVSGVATENIGKLITYENGTWAWFSGLTYNDIQYYLSIPLIDDNKLALDKVFSSLTIENLYNDLADSIYRNSTFQNQNMPLILQNGGFANTTTSSAVVENNDSKCVRSGRIYHSRYVVIVPDGYKITRFKINSSNTIISVAEHTTSWAELNQNANRVYDRLLITKLDNTNITSATVVAAGFAVKLDSDFYASLMAGFVDFYDGGIGTLKVDASVKDNHYMVYVRNDTATGATGTGTLMWWNGFDWEYKLKPNTTATYYKYSDIENHTLYMPESPIDDSIVSSKKTWTSNKIESELLNYSGGDIEEVTREAVADVLTWNRDKNYYNIAVITDTHANTGDASKSISIMNALAKSGIIDCFVHIGDLVSTKVDGVDFTLAETMDVMLEYMNQFKSIDGMLYCKGNHDNGHKSSSSSDNLTRTQYRLMFQKNVPNAVFNDANDTNSNYFYIDDDNRKVRVIVLDSFYSDTLNDANFGNAQVSWLYNTALDFSNKADDYWNVVVFVHAIFFESTTAGTETDIANILSAFANKTTVGEYSFSDNAKLVALIHGHNHVDTYDDTRGYNNMTLHCAFGTTPYVYIFTVDTDSEILRRTKITDTVTVDNYAFSPD